MSIFKRELTSNEQGLNVFFLASNILLLHYNITSWNSHKHVRDIVPSNIIIIITIIIIIVIIIIIIIINSWIVMIVERVKNKFKAHVW